ncbi:uncharacterized, partial [Tachysurus ichikawai]
MGHKNETLDVSHWILKDTAASLWYSEMSRQEYEEKSENTLTWAVSVSECTEGSVSSVLSAELV